MQKDKEEVSIGVLDIYGFEIFEVSKRNAICCDRSKFLSKKNKEEEDYKNRILAWA